MGRADVLFRFLHLIGKDRPADIDFYLKDLDVKNEDRPIADQLVDLIIAGDENLYEKYEQARKDVGSRNPYASEDDRSDESYLHTIGFFLSKWIAFELAVRSIAKEKLGVDRAPFFSILQQLQLISPNDLQSVEYVRQLRNDLVHGIRTPQKEYVVEAGYLIERMLNNVKDAIPEETRVVVDAMLKRSNL
jgi:hypothetical protein